MAILHGLEPSPREALAVALGGTLGPRDSIIVGPYVVWCSPLGVVRVGGTPIGTWDDGTEALAERFAAVTPEVGA